MLRRSVGRLSTAIGCALAVASPSRAEPPTALGPQFEVAPTLDYAPLIFPSAAMDADGDFVVVWDNDSNDYRSEGIFGRRYSSSGVPLGGVFTVGRPSPLAELEQPSAAMDPAGDFVVVWESNSDDANDQGIFGRRFSSSGDSDTGVFQLAGPLGSESLREPAVAMDVDGGFVVVWRRDGNQSESIGGRRFDGAGMALGIEIEVTPAVTQKVNSPDVAIDPDGGFVVVWDDEPYFQGEGIFGRRYDSTGAAIGGQFQIASEDLGQEYVRDPALTIDALGGFVVVWVNQTRGEDGILARRYDSLGAALASEFEVVQGEGYFFRPDVSADGEGGFVVAWDQVQYEPVGFSGVAARRYGADGLPTWSPFEVAAEDADHYNVRRATVAAEASGDFVVAWESLDASDDSQGIQARRYTVPEPGVHALELTALACIASRSRRASSRVSAGSGSAHCSRSPRS